VSTTTEVQPVLQAVDVTKKFKAHGARKGRVVHAVDEVSLDLYPGRITALVGESGCGKSTLARLLAQLYPVTEGKIRFRGKDVDASHGRAHRRHVSHVQLMLQDPYSSFNPLATIDATLKRAVAIHHPEIPRSERSDAVDALLRQVALDPPRQFAEKFPHELSGGQLQRCSIARALAADPEVFLADEPVSSLDVSIRLGVLNLLRSLAQDRGVALLYVTHDIASARYFAETTAVMYAGQLIESGPSEKVTQQAAHPYTRLLIDSAPDPHRGADAPRTVDVGQPPSLTDPPTGCRFHPRCPLATDICRVERPGKTAVDEDHWVRCWNYDAAPAQAD